MKTEKTTRRGNSMDVELVYLNLLKNVASKSSASFSLSDSR